MYHSGEAVKLKKAVRYLDEGDMGRVDDGRSRQLGLGTKALRGNRRVEE